jgi:hypothetical protein
MNVNGPLDVAPVRQKDVWFTGNGSTAQTVYKGQGVCYYFDYGTATSTEVSRYNRVELPDSSNNAHFAGVLASGYTVPAGGCVVTIYEPGSVCEVLTLSGEAATIGSSVLQFNYGDNFGLFTAETDDGIGCATALRTVSDAGANQLCLSVLQEGLQSGGVDNS